MFAFNDDKSKAPIITLEFTNSVSLRTSAYFTNDISSYLSGSADDYALISACQYIPKASSSDTSEYAGKWLFLHSLKSTNSENVMTNFNIFPTVQYYDDGNTRKVTYSVRNETSTTRNVKTRLVFLKIA